MEKNSEIDVSRWVDERLATLSPDNEWQPNTSRGLARLGEQRKGGRTRAGRWTWVAAAATAACFSIVAFPAPRALAQRACEKCSALLQSVSSSVAVRYGLKSTGSRKAAPDFTLNDASGHPVKLSECQGKVVLLNFWATWCGGCRVEIPWLIEFQQIYGHRDFVVLGVSFDEDGWKSVKPYMDAKKINYPVMIGDDDLAKRYGGLDALPMTLLIDRTGRIAATHVGLASKSEYKSEIEELLSGRSAAEAGPAR